MLGLAEMYPAAGVMVLGGTIGMPYRPACMPAAGGGGGGAPTCAPRQRAGAAFGVGFSLCSYPTPSDDSTHRPRLLPVKIRVTINPSYPYAYILVIAQHTDTPIWIRAVVTRGSRSFAL
jgi:hypothetical protein